MMQRRRFLVAYDVREARRLRKVHEVVKGFGFAMQYSVFVCDLTTKERMMLVQDLQRVMDVSIDSVAIVDLGDPNDPRPFTFLGPHELLPRSGPAIV
jgi:CRISPR-associated protein Cas2